MGAEDDAVLAIVAHGLLGSLAVCAGSLKTVLHHPELPEEKRVELLRMAEEQADHMAGVLLDLVRGLPAESREALDRLAGSGGLLPDLGPPTSD